MIRSHQPNSLLYIFLGVVCLALVAGCGDGRIKTYPVTGQVLVDGQPAGKAMVVFCPTSGSEELMRERPFAETDEKGIYQLTTFNTGDGAPAGEYQVMVRWATFAGGRQKKVGDEVVDGGRRRRKVDLLRGRYFNPKKSGLTATVVSGKNELEPFELELPPKRRR